MNKVILCGRLTRDPNVTYTQGERQMAIARYTLAVDRRGRRQEGQEQSADFIQCVCFDRSAEFAEKYLKQGTKIIVTGRIQTSSYTNKDGQRVYTTDVVVEETEFAESKAAQSGNNNASFAGNFRENESKAQSAATTADAGDGFMNIPDGVEDSTLPFN